MKLSHSSSNGCLFPEMSPGQGPSPVKCFTKAVLLEVRRTCRLATRLCSLSALGFEQESLLGAARELWWRSSHGPREASSRVPGRSAENYSTQPSSPGIFSSS